MYGAPVPAFIKPIPITVPATMAYALIDRAYALELMILFCEVADHHHGLVKGPCQPAQSTGQTNEEL